MVTNVSAVGIATASIAIAFLTVLWSSLRTQVAAFTKQYKLALAKGSG